jgi:hypothetical protein
VSKLRSIFSQLEDPRLDVPKTTYPGVSSPYAEASASASATKNRMFEVLSRLKERSLMLNRRTYRFIVTIAGLALVVLYLFLPERPLMLLIAFSLFLFLGATDFGRQCPLFQGLKNVIVKRKDLYDNI